MNVPSGLAPALHFAEAVSAARVATEVAESEYLRLLGYPPGHVPAEEVRTHIAAARGWYGANGRPWIYVYEARLASRDDTAALDGTFEPPAGLQAYLRRCGARRVLLVAVSAGRECEERAGQLWQEGRPDEYLFLEVFGSAVVEHLIAAAHHRICAEADRAGLVALPPFSPGYAGWSVAEQNSLYEFVASGGTLPGPLAVLPSGMLNPKKSQLAVIALAPATAENLAAAGQVPCARCGWRDCAYRRMPYQPVPAGAPGTPMAAPHRSAGAVPTRRGYSVNVRALEKWTAERVVRTSWPDGTLELVFRFDGTTCSNLGQLLAYEYRATFGPTAGEHVLLHAECRPVGGEYGHQSMCSYLADREQLERAISAEVPPAGRTLSELIAAVPNHAVSGCLCTAGHRAHKWRLALEVMHFALAARATESPL